MIAELKAEKYRLDEAITVLERLSAGKTRRRGRPAGWYKAELERQIRSNAGSDDEPGASAKSAGAS